MKEWQRGLCQYWGKHDPRFPATGGIPYRFDPARNGNAFTYPRVVAFLFRTLTAGAGPAWKNSPQVRMWMDEPKPGLWKRFKAWLAK